MGVDTSDFFTGSKYPCIECEAECCKYVTFPVLSPFISEANYDHLRWIIAHKNVSLYINTRNEWCVEFLTDCEMLDYQGRCKIYKTRPKICEEYPGENKTCHFYGYPYKEYFNTLEEYEEYYLKHKK